MARILVVDDIEQNLYMLRVLLEAHGCSVEDARHGGEALEKARRSAPDLIISDLLMPVMDGYTLLGHWKADEQLKRIPFVVYTATYTDPQDEKHALELGADAFIIKPMAPVLFMARIREVLASRGTAPHAPAGEEKERLREYSEVLIRMLEKKMRQLEQTNRALEAHIAERQQLEEQLRQSQKMEAIGQLAGGIAHDFNNILAAISGNTELALEDTASDHPAREFLEEIRNSSARAKRLVQQILAFSRRQPLDRRVISLEPIIEESTDLLRASLPASVGLDMEVDAGVPPVLADATQMHQVLVNLCTNAWHALEGQSGRIVVRLKSVALTADSVKPLVGLRPGNFVYLSVSDTGIGMDAATRARIFEPFFTTKEPGKGTGLGLSVVHGIVQGHDGAIVVRSQPGEGTVFEIYFPAATAIEETAAAPAPALRGQGQHILFLDDEAPLVTLAQRLLERRGYRFSGFTRASEALRAFAEKPDEFQLVITDLSMPGASGLHFASDILKLRPDVPVVLCSGHVTEELREHARRAGIREVLYKPNTVDEFGETIHRLASETRRS